MFGVCTIMATEHHIAPTAIVTGASRGLGLGVARCLATAGHQVVLAARSAPDLHAARDLIGGSAVAVETDVTAPADIDALMTITLEHFGAIDLVVNAAAAVPVLDPLESLTRERFQRGFDVDVLGTLLVSQAVAPIMRRQQRGVIANLIAARGGIPAGLAHLSVGPSQAALLALTRNLAVILHSDGIVVHALFPGLSPDGETGRTAAPALGITFGDDALSAADVGAAVLALLEHPAPGTFLIDPGGQLQLVSEILTPA